MKLVYLSEVRLPTKNAHGFQIMNMCSAFASAGAEVELLVPKRFNLLKEDIFGFYNVPRTFRIKSLPVIDLYRFRFIPEAISSFVLTFSFLIAARLYSFFKKYDVLYTREERAALFFKNYMYEVHAPEQLNKLGFKPQKSIVLTSYIKRVLVESGQKEDSIFVAPDAVNLSLFGKVSKAEARKDLGFSFEEKIALYFGNFKKWKGVDTFAEAVHLLPGVRCVMVGGTKESDVARIKEIVGGAENVLVLGFQPQEKMPTFLAAADLLILPNSAHDENSRLFTSPLKLFEYMAAERAIVASGLPSLREILNDTIAVFFKSDDAGDLARTVTALLADPARMESLSREARKEVEKYTWQKRAEQILAFIKN